MKPRYLIPLCALGFILLMGFVAENQPWGRGWAHDSLHYLKKKNPSYSAPDRKSPETQTLQQKIDQWYPEIIEKYPRLKVEYKNVPDEQNGFLKILEWQEEVSSPSQEEFTYEVNTELPAGFLEEIDWKHLLANPQEIEAFLAPKRLILERAIAIGLLPRQSSASISPDRYLFRISFFSTRIIRYLRLKAIAEAHRGDATATLKTLKAIRGWADHYSKTETPYLLTITIATSIHLSLQSTIHNEILPLLAKDDIDYAQWGELTKSEPDLQHQWMKMWRGEWYVIAKSKWNAQVLLDENPRDPIAFLNASASAFNSISDPETFNNLNVWEAPPPTSKLSRKSRDFYQALFIDDIFISYGKGLQRSHTILRQYEVAFTLQKLEDEGQNLKSLDQKTINSLPLQILPDLKLSIDFDKREITAPTEIPDAKPISF